jgi:sterol desaturase/sphingolipid hydroxylase (fatty acid hydroxylase superfamily)
VANYISNKDESVAMFERSWLDKLTHMHPSTPVILYLPVILYFLYRTFAAHQLGLFTAAGLFVAGGFVWTLTEYLMHRFVFHYQPTTRWGKWVHFVFHGVHHDYPRDSSRLVMAPVVSIPLAVLFYCLFLILAGPVRLPPFFAGFIFGYLCYDMIHYATHHLPMHSRIGQWLKQYHALHHYQDADLSYGVSTPLWDYVFRTTPQRVPRFRSVSGRAEISD